MKPAKNTDINIQSHEKPHTLFCVNHQKNEHFVPRPEIFQKLRHFVNKTDKKPTRVMLRGLGGMGKSQVALEFCYQSRDRYQYIFWMEADTETTLQNSFKVAVDMLDLQPPLLPDENLTE